MSTYWTSRSTPSFPWRREVALGTVSLMCAVVVGCGTTPTEPANQSPTASFTQSCTDLACTFNASASTDSDGSIATLAWDFGDGATGTGTTPAHTYTAAGSYSVGLTVTDNDGATGTATQSVSVTAANQSPSAAFTFGCSGADCSFDASTSMDADGTIATWAWDFGDGTNGTGVTATHTYASYATFTVTLTVTDDQTATDTDAQSVTTTSPFVQLGPLLPGLTTNEQFGRSVAMSDDGLRIVGGAPFSSAGASLSGQVRAFEWDGSAWNQLGQSIDGFEASLLLGDDKTVTMSGNGQRIAIGTPRVASSRGSVRVYELIAGTWTLLGQEIIPPGGATSQFGTGVSLSTDGSRLAIGGPLGGGRVEVYELVAGSWTQMGSSLLGTSPYRQGYDVALSGDGTRVLASVQGATVGSQGGAGKLRVFDWNGTDWIQVGGDIDGRGGFGLNVEMSRDGSRVVGYAASTGDYAAVFELVGGVWTQMGPDFVVPGAFDIHQNVDLSASGDRVVIGSMYGPPNGHGTLNVYDWTGGAWVQVGTGVTGPAQGVQLGWSVAISADGSRVVAGIRLYENSGPGSNTGALAAYLIN